MNASVLTFATHAGFEFCGFYRSAVQHGIQPRLLGWGSAADGRVLQNKLRMVADEISGYDDSRIVLFVDSFDLLFLDDLRTIVERFTKMGVPVLFAAEKGCYPLDVADQYPPAPTPWRFLNSGAYIGYAGPVKRLIADMLTLPEAQGEAMDQELATRVFLARPRDIALDYRCEIFMCVHLSQWEVWWWRGRYRNLVTGTSPAIVHFNGNGKQDQLRFSRRLGHAGQTVNAHALPAFEAAVVGDCCPTVAVYPRRIREEWLWLAKTGYVSVRDRARSWLRP